MDEKQTASWDPKSARQGNLDGRFLVGYPDEGTYNLPSCTVKRPRKAERLVFASEALAKAAGLKPCKVCKPDRFHGAQGDGLALFKRLAEEIGANPSVAPSVDVLAEHAGLPLVQLQVILADHAQLRAGEWLERLRVRHAARRLIGSKANDVTIADDAGFANEKAFAAGFENLMGMTPADYRQLGLKHAFQLRLPANYRPGEVLSYQGRDPEGLAERSDGKKIWKALATPDGPAILEIAFKARVASVNVTSDVALGPESMAKLHRDTLKILGLGTDISHFENAHADLVGTRTGLRVPLIPSAFDALCWAITGQQINLSFAGSLRRELILLAGSRVGDMIVHPTPDAIAALDPTDLTSRRFSRSKTKYLINAAQAIVEHRLDVEGLVDGSAIEAETLLTAQNGIGTWTARYVMMRTGFADAAPVGDSGLATALHRLYGMPERPDATETARLMAMYSPWRSLASMHLWTSLHD